MEVLIQAIVFMFITFILFGILAAVVTPFILFYEIKVSKQTKKKIETFLSKYI